MTIFVKEPERKVFVNDLEYPLMATEDVPFQIYLLNKVRTNLSDQVEWGLIDDLGFLTIDPKNGTLSGRPTQEDVGLHAVVVHASDDEWNMEVIEFDLVVRDFNDPPVPYKNSILIITGPGESFSIKIPVIDEDDPNEDLEWAVLSNNTLIMIDPVTGWIRGRAEIEDIGVHFLEISVKDPAENKASIEIVLLVMGDAKYRLENGSVGTGQWKNLTGSDIIRSEGESHPMISDNMTGCMIVFPVTDELRSNLTSMEWGDGEKNDIDRSSDDGLGNQHFIFISIIIISIMIIFFLLRSHISHHGAGLKGVFYSKRSR
jgi:hypothetical protein